MAKVTQLEKFQRAIPRVKEIHLPMLADCSVETAIEINTDLAAGMSWGWEIYGFTWCFRVSASPHILRHMSPAVADESWVLQLCRGDMPATPVTLAPSAEDHVMEDAAVIEFATAVGTNILPGWRSVARRATTQRSSLYLMFGAETDIVDVSDPAIEIYAELAYRVVPGPLILGERL